MTTTELNTPLVLRRAGELPDPLGPLALLPGPGNTPGVWTGHGFNAIWLPNRKSTGQNRFLQLNLTDETITFTRISGGILNRGLAMPDIQMHGVTYTHQSNAAGNPDRGLHIEPGIWTTVPATSDPAGPASVVRMASIPHGTVINAQGVFRESQGCPHIANNNILPYYFDTPAPTNSQFAEVAAKFPELDLSTASEFRSPADGITQRMVRNPNDVLQRALQTSLQRRPMRNTTTLQVSTTNSIIESGGGTANIAFLASSQNPRGGNANVARLDATFWIETIAAPDDRPDTHQLQYTQLVVLDFDGIHWPHVSVGTLRKL